MSRRRVPPMFCSCHPQHIDLEENLPPAPTAGQQRRGGCKFSTESANAARTDNYHPGRVSSRAPAALAASSRHETWGTMLTVTGLTCHNTALIRVFEEAEGLRRARRANCCAWPRPQ